MHLTNINNPSYPENAMAAKGVYQPLDFEQQQIRILHVQDASDVAATLECQLDVVSKFQNSTIQYEAISYCWGEGSGEESILLNGVVTEVPASAAKVLRRFRSKSSSRAFWIDAICINQTDIEERSTQVSIMDHIYAKCSRCLISLGDSDGKTKPVLRALRTISREYYDQLHQVTDGFAEETPDDFKYAIDFFPVLFNDCSAQDIAKFFERAWFSRVWVQQEAILSPEATCYCGDYTIEWPDVYRASRWLVAEWPNIEEEVGLDKVLGSLDMVWIFAESALLRAKGVALSTVLNGTRYLEATDVRDKFYGILGLAEKPNGTEVFMGWFKVDYGKPVASVFADATLSSFIRQGSLTAFEYVDQVRFNTRVTGNEGFRSWCLRLDRNFEDDTRFNFGADRFCCPVELDFSMLQSCAGQNYVRLKGFKIDRVNRVLAEAEADSDAPALVGEMLAAGTNALFEQRDDHARILLDCLTTGRQTKFLASLTNEECSQILNMLIKICTASTDEEEAIEVDAETDEKLIDSLSTIYNNARRVCMNRCLFQLFNGTIGLGHPSLRENDRVVALAGGKYPCILRPFDRPSDVDTEFQKPGRTTYQFVGLAYVPGVMSGEVVDEKQEAELELEVFEIC